MHGPDKRLVGDLKVTMSVSNTVLEHLGQDLRTALYRKPETGEDPQGYMLPLVSVDGQYAGKLCQLIQEDIKLTLVPPSADEQEELAA